jgi:hypothetical protein
MPKSLNDLQYDFYANQNFTQKITTSGTDTFVAIAIPGTLQSEAKWQAQKVDTDGNITWADGNAEFDNIATDLTALTYS